MTATLTGPPPVTVLPPPSPPHDPVQAFRDGLFKFTSADAERMVKLGVLPEDSSVELLGGVFVHRDCGSSKGEPGVAGIEHDYVVRMIGKLDRHIDGPGRHLVTQLTLRLSDDYDPVPDAMVLRGPAIEYRALAAYARAGVPQYVIVNLRDRTAEVYAGPDPAAGTYPPPLVVRGDGGTLLLRVGEGETFSVELATLLP
jgi:hypothetical protein